MKQINKNSLLKIIILLTCVNTIAITPFWNKDGMIIPKLILMFTLSMYLLPTIVANRHLVLSSKIVKTVVIIQCILLVQSLFVLISSAAPLEQQIFGRTGRGLGLTTTFSLAIILIATMLLIENNRKNYVLFGLILSGFIIAGFFSIAIELIIFSWYKNKFLFGFMLLSGFISALFAILGMLNIGPMSGYLYKISVQSRGDFWRAAFNTANDNPIFGVGLDSFGDYSLKYRDAIAANHGFAEYTDNAHNFFLEYAATGGYLSAILNLLTTFFVLFAFVVMQKSIRKFDVTLVSLFSAWAAFQMTTIISPGNLVTMHWNAVISGAILGLAKFVSPAQSPVFKASESKLHNPALVSFIFGITALVIMYPVFSVDRMQLTGMQTGDANLVIKATTSYPESTVRYSLIGQELLTSGLTQQSLELARAGIEFNPNSPGLWALILVNPNAQKDERLVAKERILELDPLNKEVQNFNP